MHLTDWNLFFQFLFSLKSTKYCDTNWARSQSTNAHSFQTSQEFISMALIPSIKFEINFQQNRHTYVERWTTRLLLVLKRSVYRHILFVISFFHSFFILNCIEYRVLFTHSIQSYKCLGRQKQTTEHRTIIRFSWMLNLYFS